MLKRTIKIKYVALYLNFWWSYIINMVTGNIKIKGKARVSWTENTIHDDPRRRFITHIDKQKCLKLDYCPTICM